MRHVDHDASHSIPSNPIPAPTPSLLDLMVYYNDSLSSALNTLVPLKTRVAPFIYTAP